MRQTYTQGPFALKDTSEFFFDSLCSVIVLVTRPAGSRKSLDILSIRTSPTAYFVSLCISIIGRVTRFV